MPDLGQWRPLYDTHAIELVNAKVLFTQAVTDIPWKQIQGRARELGLRLQLVTERPIQHISFTIEEEAQGPLSSSKDIGVEFLRLERPDFYSDKLAIERSSIIFESFQYTRWKSFQNKLEETLKILLELYLASVPIYGIQVEYVDRFNAMLPDDAPDCGAIIQHPSQFIAEGAFKENEVWHCHTGFFKKPDSRTKRLANLDVDVADISRRDVQGSTTTIRTIRIRTQVTDFFNQKGYDCLLDEEVTPEFVCERMNELHLDLKGMLGSVITDSAAKAISLVGDENA